MLRCLSLPKAQRGLVSLPRTRQKCQWLLLFRECVRCRPNSLQGLQESGPRFYLHVQLIYPRKVAVLLERLSPGVEPDWPHGVTPVDRANIWPLEWFRHWVPTGCWPCRMPPAHDPPRRRQRHPQTRPGLEHWAAEITGCPRGQPCRIPRSLCLPSYHLSLERFGTEAGGSGGPRRVQNVPGGWKV